MGMSETYRFFPNLEAEVSIPENGILSRTLYNHEHVKVLIFGFAAGQELSAHTAPMAASVYFVSGEAKLTLGAEVQDVRENSFAYMPPQLPHGIVAKTPVGMLLSMYKESRG